MGAYSFGTCAGDIAVSGIGTLTQLLEEFRTYTKQEATKDWRLFLTNIRRNAGEDALAVNPCTQPVVSVISRTDAIPSDGLDAQEQVWEEFNDEIMGFADNYQTRLCRVKIWSRSTDSSCRGTIYVKRGLRRWPWV
jgi:hypothetical protein